MVRRSIAYAAKMEAERDALKSALEKIRDHDHGAAVTFGGSIAREALGKEKP